MAVERIRPMKTFRVLKVHGNYAKGALMQPTGMLRDILLRKGIIEEVTDEVRVEAKGELDNREITPRGELVRRGPGRPRKVVL
jgi:hypothetical protein